MSEQQVRDFGTRAEELVTVPDFEVLDHRGRRRLLRRRAFVAGAAALVLAAGGFLVHADGPPKADEPVDPPNTPVRAMPYPVQSDKHEPGTLTAGTYEVMPSYKPFAPTARFTVPRGWTASNGPSRFAGRGSVMVQVMDVTAVTTVPCRVLTTGMDEVGNRPRALVAALVRLPGHEVSLAPEPDDRFGYPSTHLRLVESSGARCPHDARYELFDSDTGGTIAATGEPSTLKDLWVVVADGYTLVVAATSAPDTPAWALAQMYSIVDSIEFVPAG